MHHKRSKSTFAKKNNNQISEYKLLNNPWMQWTESIKIATTSIILGRYPGF